MKLFGYKKCSTSNKAEKWLIDRGISYEFLDIRENKFNKDDIKNFHEISNLDIKRFFNTSGNIYKELKLKDKLAAMSLEEKYELLGSEAMLIKRPLVVDEEKNIVLIGFKEIEWAETFGR